MVEGLQGRKIAVVDLDGTLIDGNSFHLYIRTAFRHSSLMKKMRICVWLALRQLRVVSHRKMKFALLGLIVPDDSFKNEFCSSFITMIRPEMNRIIDELRKDKVTVLLASAAPDIYISWVWHGAFVATRTLGNETKVECRGERKVEAIKAFMNPEDSLVAVYTDHSDDLPLLAMGAAKNYLVSPSSQTLKAVNAALLSATVI